MASTDPLSGLTVNDQGDAALSGYQIGRAVAGLSSMVNARFVSTSARDTGWSAWSTANGGAAIPNGAVAWCDNPGAFFDRIGGVWVRRGVEDYAKAGLAADLTQVAANWCTVPLAGLATEGRAGIYTLVQRNNAAYTAHPARGVIRFEVEGLYTVEGQQATDTVGTLIRLARNIDTALEALAVSAAGQTSGASSASTTRRFAAGDVVALQGYHSAAYIALLDGKSIGTPAYKVNTHLTVTRLGD